MSSMAKSASKKRNKAGARGGPVKQPGKANKKTDQGGGVSRRLSMSLAVGAADSAGIGGSDVDLDQRGERKEVDSEADEDADESEAGGEDPAVGAHELGPSGATGSKDRLQALIATERRRQAEEMRVFRQEQQQQLQALRQQLLQAQAAESAHGAGARAVAAATTKMPTIAQLSYFNGEMDTDALGLWLRELRVQVRYYSAHGYLGTDVAQIAYAAAFLRGGAADWWEEAEASGSIDTFVEFVEAIERRFRSRTDADVADAELVALRQKAGQPVTKHIAAFQQLLIRCPDYKDAPPAITVRVFVRGLQERLAQRLREAAPATFEEAVELAVRIEGSFGRQQQGDKGKGLAAVGLNSVEAEERDEAAVPRALAAQLGAMQEQLNAVMAGRGGGARGGPGGDVGGGAVRQPYCFRCGDRGHLVNRCTKTESVCYGCKEAGHVRKDCPKRAQRAQTPAQAGK